MTGGWSRTAYALTSNTGAVTNANNMVQGSSDFRFMQSQLEWHGVVSIRRDQVDAPQPALRRLLQRAVLRRVVRIPGLQLPQQPNQFLLPQDRRFNMSFTLAGVGSFSNFFGAFGGGTR